MRPTDEELAERLRQASDELRQATELLRAANDQRRLSARHASPPKRPEFRLIQGGREEE